RTIIMDTRIQDHFKNGSFIKTKSGILYILHAVLSNLTFVCTIWSIYATFPPCVWIEVVSFSGFVLALVLLLINMIQIPSDLGCIPWDVVEIIYTSIWAFFFAIIGIVDGEFARKSNDSVLGAATFFALLAMGLLVTHTFLLIHNRRSKN
ncbi:unnamed protein product, partial [Meganyctiphanes norvegica]